MDVQVITLLALVLFIWLDTAEQSAQSLTSHDYTEVEEACAKCGVGKMEGEITDHKENM